MVHEPDPNSLLGQLQRRARRVPAALRALFIVGAFALSGLALFADLPPYSLIAEAQASLFDGKHYLMLSGSLTLLFFLLPVLLVIQALAGLFKEPEIVPPRQYPY